MQPAAVKKEKGMPEEMYSKIAYLSCPSNDDDGARQRPA